MKHGQGLVEFALVMVIFMPLLLGIVETGFLFRAVLTQDHSTAVIAEWAAQHPGEDWQPVADRELRGCDVAVSSPLPDVVEASARCIYHPIVFRGWNLLPISSRESAAVTH